MGETEAKPKKRVSKATTAKIAREYFESVARRDFDVYDRLWAPDAKWNVYGLVEGTGPAGLRAFFEANFAAIGDLDIQITDVFADGGRAAVHWRMRGTFSGPAQWQGIEPNGARIDIAGLDLVVVDDGLIASIVGYTDFATVARQMRMLPAQGSAADRATILAFNAKTRIAAKVAEARGRRA